MPEYIQREVIEEPTYFVPQYRSVYWGDVKNWRDIDPLNQPAAYEKPSYRQVLIEPDYVMNTYDNQQYKSLYGGFGGVMRRSEGVDYNKRIFKHTPSNGYRRDTKTKRYEHTDESYVDSYYGPKEYMLYPDYTDYSTVATRDGVVIIGDDDPLEYPRYKTKKVTYQKMVPQNYEVTQT